MCTRVTRKTIAVGSILLIQPIHRDDLRVWEARLARRLPDAAAYAAVKRILVRARLLAPQRAAASEDLMTDHKGTTLQ